MELFHNLQIIQKKQTVQIEEDRKNKNEFLKISKIYLIYQINKIEIKL